MKKQLLSIFLILCVILSNAQNGSKETNDKEIIKLQRITTNQNQLILNQASEIKLLKKSNEFLKKELDQIRMKQKEDSVFIANRLSTIEKQFQVSTRKTGDRFIQVDDSMYKKSLYGTMIILAAILLIVIVYLELRRRQKLDKSDVIDQLNNAKQSIEESLVKEFEKQTIQMEDQLKVLNSNTAVPVNSNIEPDHSLALKVASEINLIERNISLMDAGTKGLKQLSRSVSKLKDNLAANGYEIPELIGKQFHQGMKVIVSTSLPDENLEKGSEIITKVLIPQVNFNDKMIQTAQIEVSVGI